MCNRCVGWTVIIISALLLGVNIGAANGWGVASSVIAIGAGVIWTRL